MYLAIKNVGTKIMLVFPLRQECIRMKEKMKSITSNGLGRLMKPIKLCNLSITYSTSLPEEVGHDHSHSKVGSVSQYKSPIHSKKAWYDGQI